MKAKIILLLVLSTLVSIGYTQTDSINVIELQNKKNPQNIEILKIGRRVSINLKNGYSINGKLTEITDTSFVINNKYRIQYTYALIKDYSFMKHRVGRIILGAIGGFYIVVFGAFPLIEGGIAAFSGFGIIVVPVIIAASVVIGFAVSKDKFSINDWDVSMKKIKG